MAAGKAPKEGKSGANHSSHNFKWFFIRFVSQRVLDFLLEFRAWKRQVTYTTVHRERGLESTGIKQVAGSSRT